MACLSEERRKGLSLVGSPPPPCDHSIIGMVDTHQLVGQCEHCHRYIRMAMTYFQNDKPYYFNPRPDNSVYMFEEDCDAQRPKRS
jgi:hypothetical protein